MDNPCISLSVIVLAQFDHPWPSFLAKSLSKGCLVLKTTSVVSREPAYKFFVSPDSTTL